MPPRRTRPNDPKTAALQAAGALHPRPEAVQDEAFSQHEFFDPRDRVQVKYEMLRRHRIEGHPVTEVAGTFGVSRQAFYTASASFEAEGLPGLLPRRRGPKRAHKCTDAVLDFVEAWRVEDEAHAGENVSEAVRRRFGVTINPRSIDRALARRKKNAERLIRHEVCRVRSAVSGRPIRGLAMRGHRRGVVGRTRRWPRSPPPPGHERVARRGGSAGPSLRIA